MRSSVAEGIRDPLGRYGYVRSAVHWDWPGDRSKEFVVDDSSHGPDTRDNNRFARLLKQHADRDAKFERVIDDLLHRLDIADTVQNGARLGALPSPVGLSHEFDNYRAAMPTEEVERSMCERYGQYPAIVAEIHRIAAPA